MTADNISNLFLLQATSKNSVVSHDQLTDIQNLMYLRTELDSYVKEHCALALNAGETRLIILSGNAGDGKSMILRHLKDHLSETGHSSKLQINYDATQTSSPKENLTVSLFHFFDQFLQDLHRNESRIYVIGMNMGIAIKLFNSNTVYQELCSQSDLDQEHSKLKTFIMSSLMLGEAPRQLIDTGLVRNVEIINLDNRMLVTYHVQEIPPVHSGPSFFEKIIGKLPLLFNENECATCSARSKCPVYFNVQSVRSKEIQVKLENMLFKVFLYNKVHLTPRNLWDFLFNVLVGGTEKFLRLKEQHEDVELPPCEIVRRTSASMLADLTFYRNLFDAESTNAILAYISASLPRFDPFYMNNKSLELIKIFTTANPSAFLRDPREILQGLIADLEFPETETDTLFGSRGAAELNGSVNLLENVTRFVYFHSGDSEQIPDILYGDSAHVLTKNDFLEFLSSLRKAACHYLEEGTQRIDVPVAKNIRKSLTQIFGAKIGDSYYFRIGTLSTRGKGRLLSKSPIDVGLEIVDGDLKDFNRECLRCLGYIPPKFSVLVNEREIGIDFELYELIVMSNKGYNITSVDLDRYHYLQAVGKGVFQPPPNEQEILYEFENEYFKFFNNHEDYLNEFKRIEGAQS